MEIRQQTIKKISDFSEDLRLNRKGLSIESLCNIYNVPHVTAQAMRALGFIIKDKSKRLGFRVTYCSKLSFADICLIVVRERELNSEYEKFPKLHRNNLINS